MLTPLIFQSSTQRLRFSIESFTLSVYNLWGVTLEYGSQNKMAEPGELEVLGTARPSNINMINIDGVSSIEQTGLARFTLKPLINLPSKMPEWIMRNRLSGIWILIHSVNYDYLSTYNIIEIDKSLTIIISYFSQKKHHNMNDNAKMQLKQTIDWLCDFKQYLKSVLTHKYEYLQIIK